MNASVLGPTKSTSASPNR
eukprot:gene18148-biopygen17383